jgi:hypothetical protein
VLVEGVLSVGPRGCGGRESASVLSWIIGIAMVAIIAYAVATMGKGTR